MAPVAAWPPPAACALASRLRRDRRSAVRLLPSADPGRTGPQMTQLHGVSSTSTSTSTSTSSWRTALLRLDHIDAIVGRIGGRVTAERAIGADTDGLQLRSRHALALQIIGDRRRAFLCRRLV